MHWIFLITRLYVLNWSLGKKVFQISTLLYEEKFKRLPAWTQHPTEPCSTLRWLQLDVPVITLTSQVYQCWCFWVMELFSTYTQFTVFTMVRKNITFSFWKIRLLRVMCNFLKVTLSKLNEHHDFKACKKCMTLPVPSCIRTHDIVSMCKLWLLSHGGSNLVYLFKNFLHQSFPV